jgi:hypothetical protein
MPHVLFSLAMELCPWPGCGFRIGMIDFKLELYGDSGLYSRVVSAWWNPGYGVIARCPGCQRHVLFGVDRKEAVSDPIAAGFEILRDDWHTIAFLQ